MSTSALLETLTLPEARRVLREISLLSDSLDKLVLESVSAVIAESLHLVDPRLGRLGRGSHFGARGA